MPEFFLEFVVPVLIFFLLRKLLRGVFEGLKRPVPKSREVHAGGTLHKDPICGTYVSSDSGVVQTIKGQAVYFCSPECRDKYLAGARYG